jgi:hypothetical protein
MQSPEPQLPSRPLACWTPLSPCHTPDTSGPLASSACTPADSYHHRPCAARWELRGTDPLPMDAARHHGAQHDKPIGLTSSHSRASIKSLGALSRGSSSGRSSLSSSQSTLVLLPSGCNPVVRNR